MLTKSLHHDHFYTQDSVIYETLENGQDEVVLKLNCYYPNHKKLKDPMINYLNRYLEMFPPKIPEANEQLALF